MAYPAGGKKYSTNSSLPEEKTKPGSYVKPGGKATGSMKDYALNTQARRDEYTARGWKQDKTTEIKSAAPTIAKASPAKSAGNPNGVTLGGPKSGSAYDRVKAYADNPANFKGKTQAEAMGNSSGKADNKAIGKNSNIAKLTNNKPKVSASDIDKTLDTKGTGGEVSKSAKRTQGAHTYAQSKGINPTAGAKSQFDGLVTGLDKSSSYANLDLSPGKTANSQIRKESASKPKQTTLGAGGGSGMGQAHAMNMSMASTIDKATSPKGLFAGLKERRNEKKASTPDPSLTTLKQKDGQPSSGYSDSQANFQNDMKNTFDTGSESSEVMKIYEDERNKYL